ncbi:MAG TPA: response regulator [Terriglobales bacterium]|nr:response regulator [Terriglobales bacterium]
MTQNFSVLLVDDSEALLKATQTILELEGYKVITTNSGTDALIAFETQQFHAVVLDFNLPDIGGEILAERMAKADPNVRIVMFSGAENIPSMALRHVDWLVKKGEAGNQLVEQLARLLAGNKRSDKGPTSGLSLSTMN